MEELEKIAIRLKHWVGHNLEHTRAYEEVADKLADLGLEDASMEVRQAVDLSSKANEKFATALSSIESKLGKISECCQDKASGHCCSDHESSHHSH